MHLRHEVAFLEIKKSLKKEATKIPVSNSGNAENRSRSREVISLHYQHSIPFAELQ